MRDLFKEGHALVIGVGGDLPNTEQDAKGLADLLRDPARCAYPSSQVQVLTTQAATRSGILQGLDALIKAAKAEDIVIVYFSGHGYRLQTPFGDQYFLMPYGYDVKDLAGTALAADLFLQTLRQIRAQKILLLLDCCYAGGLEDTKVPGYTFEKMAMPPDAQARFAEGAGRLLIASSRNEEVSYAGKPYSMFTLALLEALCGAGASHKDGYVRVTDVALYAAGVVAKRSQDRQHPIFDFKGADNFHLAYYAAGDKEPKGLPFHQPAEVENAPGQFTPVDPPLATTIQIDQSTHTTIIDNRGGVYQPGWQVGGNVNQARGDFFQAGGDIHIHQAPATTSPPENRQKSVLPGDRPLPEVSLSGAQFGQLHRALTQAYPTMATMRLMVQTALGENLDVVAGGNTLSESAFNLIQWAGSRGWMAKLIDGAYRQSPDMPLLRDFAKVTLGLTENDDPGRA